MHHRQIVYLQGAVTGSFCSLWTLNPVLHFGALFRDPETNIMAENNEPWEDVSSFSSIFSHKFEHFQSECISSVVAMVDVESIPESKHCVNFVSEWNWTRVGR